MSNNKNFQINEEMRNNEIMYINDYKIIKRVGFGSSGLVYKVTNKNDPSNKIYILKQIPYSEPNLEETTKKVQSAKNEALILSKLNCKFIVKYYDSFVDSDNNLNIIMEYCDNGDLNSFINKLKKENKYLNEEEIWFYFIQISLGLAYIHSKNILHRDLKPMNIFLTNKNQIKIGDLGVAKLLNTNANASTCIGTPYYLSPEICKEKPYNSKGDVWALGCILYELCTFNKPFSASNPVALILKIIDGNYTPLNEVKNGQKYSKDLENMITNILQKDYELRPLMKDIINSQIFINKAKLYGFKEDLENIQTLHKENCNNNINGINITEIIANKNINNNNKNMDINLNPKKNNNNNNKNIVLHTNINKNNSNSNNSKAPFIHSFKMKKNYLSTGLSTNDSSHNYDKVSNLNNLNINDSNSKKNIINNNNNQNDSLYSTKYKLKSDAILKPRTKYIKYIIKNKDKDKDKESNSRKKQNNYNINNSNNRSNNINIKTNKNVKTKSIIELNPRKAKTKIKMFQISPLHYRDRSGGRYDHKNLSIINKANFFGPNSSKCRVNNSNEKKYINKIKNSIYTNIYSNKRNNNINIVNNNYIGMVQNKKKADKNKDIKINEEYINDNNNKNYKNILFSKKNINNDINSTEIINNYHPKEVQNDKNDKYKINLNYNNFFNKNNLNNLNNININYSLNLIEKTRSNFYNKNFLNNQTPVDIIKMQTQNNFNNCNNFRIESDLENTNNNFNNNIEKNNVNNNNNKSEDLSEEEEINNVQNYLDDEIIEDSGVEDEDDEEKVSIVKEKNYLQKEKMKKQKGEYIQKYNEYKNKILQYKNIIDIYELFSLYEKISKNKSKIEENTKEIEDYMKNNLSDEVYPKFRKLFNYYIYYDIKIQNLNSL